MSNLIFVESLGLPPATNTKSADFDGVNDHLLNTSWGKTPTIGILSFWVYANSGAIATTNRMFFSGSKAAWVSTSQIFIQVRALNSGTRPGGIRVAWRAAGSYWDWEWHDGLSGLFTEGNWHHVAIYQDGVEPVLYFDGVEPPSITKTTSTDTTLWLDDAVTALIDEFAIGNRYRPGTGNAAHWLGQVDQVSTWGNNTAITIAELYASGTPPDITAHANYAGLCNVYLPLGEGADSAATAFDIKGSEDFTWTSADADPYSSNVP